MRWINRENRCPHDNTPLTSRQLVENYDMRALVAAYNARQVRMSDSGVKMYIQEE